MNSSDVVVVVLDYFRTPSSLDKLDELQLLLVFSANFGILSFIGFINWFLHYCSIYLATSVKPVVLHSVVWTAMVEPGEIGLGNRVKQVRPGWKPKM